MSELERLLEDLGRGILESDRPISLSELGFDPRDAASGSGVEVLDDDEAEQLRPTKVTRSGWQIVLGVCAVTLIAFLPNLLGGSSDPATGPSTTIQSTSSELTLYTNHEDGYELLLPKRWVESTTGPDGGYFEAEGLWDWYLERGDTPYPGVRRFGFEQGGGLSAHVYPALTISVGEPDGSVHSCQLDLTVNDSFLRRECVEVVFTTLDDLGEHLISTTPEPVTFWQEELSEFSLDGHPARIERPSTPELCLGCLRVFYHVYLIHEGRPVILTFDYWSVRTPEWVPQVEGIGQDFERILESFRFLPDPDSSVTTLAPNG